MYLYNSGHSALQRIFCIPRQHELAVTLIEKGMVRVKPVITHAYPLSNIHEAFDTMESRLGMKVLLHPHA